MLPVDVVIVCVTLLILTIVVTVGYSLVAGVPYVPTPVSVARAMVDFARLRGDERIFDLGAGNGTILIEAKRKHPLLDATGVEITPTVWLLGRLKIFFSRQKITFLRSDARMVDVRTADAVFLYLSPHLLAVLEDKFDRELRPGTVVISHAFRFPRRQPVEVAKLPRWTGQKTLLRYEW